MATARLAQSREWWAEVRAADGAPIDPIVWAPWSLLVREAQFGVEKGGRWMVHVPSMALVTWPDHRELRVTSLQRYSVVLRRVNREGQDDLSRRRALRSLERPQTVLGVLRAVEIMAALVPHRIALQVPSQVPGRAANWCHARLAGSPVPAAPDR